VAVQKASYFTHTQTGPLVVVAKENVHQTCTHAFCFKMCFFNARCETEREILDCKMYMHVFLCMVVLGCQVVRTQEM
jgi:hypothetical protein